MFSNSKKIKTRIKNNNNNIFFNSICKKKSIRMTFMCLKIFLGPPDCDKLCAEADLLLAKSHEKEKDGDLVMAALLCDSAAGNLFQKLS